MEASKTGQLPTPRRGLKAAVIDNIIFITCGVDASHKIILSSILYWDPVAESWHQPDGVLCCALAVARFWHAAVAVLSAILQPHCSAMLSI